MLFINRNIFNVSTFGAGIPSVFKGIVIHFTRFDHSIAFAGRTPTRKALFVSKSLTAFKFPRLGFCCFLTRNLLGSQNIFPLFVMQHNHPFENVWRQNKDKKANKSIKNKTAFCQSHNNLLNHIYPFLLLFRNKKLAVPENIVNSFLPAGKQPFCMFRKNRPSEESSNNPGEQL
nr:MAG TPA: hypothetical protein [Caudoviricetes sp.]